MNLLYFTNIPSPYKIDFLNELSKSVEIDAIFDGVDEDGRNQDWYKDNRFFFNTHFIKGNGFRTINSLLEKHYDIILIGNYATVYGGYLIRKLHKRKIPFILNADGGFVATNSNIITENIKKYFISKASYYLSTGKETNKYLVHYGADPEKIFTYSFTSLKEKDILNKTLSYEEKTVLRNDVGYNCRRLFVSVGSFIRRKGYDLFLEAIRNKEFNDCLFLLVGGGEKKKEFEEFIKDNSISNVRIIDFCSKQEVFNYLKMADVFFFPSREDIWGLVINEAMACGLPIVSSNNVIASKELIDEEFLYEPEDTEAQFDLLYRLYSMTDDELYKLGKKNLESIRKYTIENMAKRHLEVFNEVLKHETE